MYSCFFCFRALSTQQGGYVRATNLYYYYYYTFQTFSYHLHWSHNKLKHLVLTIFLDRTKKWHLLSRSWYWAPHSYMFKYTVKTSFYVLILLFYIISEESDEEDERPTRRRRLAERAAEGVEDDEEVNKRFILIMLTLLLGEWYLCSVYMIAHMWYFTRIMQMSWPLCMKVTSVIVCHKGHVHMHLEIGVKLESKSNTYVMSYYDSVHLLSNPCSVWNSTVSNYIILFIWKF